MSLAIELNSEQKKVVCAPFGHQLVLAGAGSGKTRVLVHRIAWLVAESQVSPYNIMAVTFTNKAANELRARVETTLSGQLKGIMLGTFHGLCHQLLRQHAEKVNLPSTFQVMDSDDQQRLIKKIHKEFGLDEDKWPAKKTQSFINQQKEQGRRSKDIGPEHNPFTAQMITIYKRYEAMCETSALVDFTELMLRTYELLRDDEELRTHYQTRLNHILVDEFQDTNALQYAWLKLFVGDNTYVMVVGDDDQSIYSWRGAKVENIFAFEKDFPDVSVSRLEQNYRSTGNILGAANEVIHYNTNRMGKKLWTESNMGEKISVYQSQNEFDEARFVAHYISKCLQQGKSYDEIAVLYRSNAQSRVLEEQLVKQQIPYRIYGGLRFFDRAEIKDALAYFRLVANMNDDAAFERIINTPTRGIGMQTLDSVREFARANAISMMTATQEIIQTDRLSARAKIALEKFVELHQSCCQLIASHTLDVACDKIIQLSGLTSLYQNDKSDKGQAKLENLFELFNAIKQFSEQQPESKLTDFLSQVALDVGDATQQGASHGVQLMTLHAAKGLEFAVVFLLGLEEGLFPHKMSASDPDRLEEERRLCYVGMTRAMQKLYLSYSETRRLYGQEVYQRPSRFLEEVPEKYLDPIKLGQTIDPYSNRQRSTQYSGFSSGSSSSVDKQPLNQSSSEAGMGYHLGQRVKHPKFGEGVILNCEGDLTDGRVQVKFNEAGVKWLLAQYANLEFL